MKTLDRNTSFMTQNVCTNDMETSLKVKNYSLINQVLKKEKKKETVLDKIHVNSNEDER